MIVLATSICKSCGHKDPKVQDILCNRCGKSMKVFISSDHKHTNFPGLHAKVEGCYGSQHDGLLLKFDLCESCLKEIMTGFAIKAEQEEISSWE